MTWLRILVQATSAVVVIGLLVMEILASSVDATDLNSLHASRNQVDAETIVQWTRLKSPSQIGGFWCEANFTGDSPRILPSPDGGSFLILTARGDIATDTVVYELRLFATKPVKAMLQSDGHVHKIIGRVLARVQARYELQAIRGVRWNGLRNIEYLAGFDGHPAQVYQQDLLTGARAQLTHQATDVLSYSISGRKIMYLAEHLPEKHTLRVADPTGVGADLITPRPRPFHDGKEAIASVYISNVTNGRVLKISMPPMALLCDAWQVSLSPDGMHGIFTAPAVSPPKEWSAYATSRPQDNFGLWRNHIDLNDRDLEHHTRLMLVQTASGKASPLLDAPTGEVAYNFAPHDLIWTNNDHIITSNTYLPLAGASSIELPNREGGPAVAEVDIRHHSAVPILWEKLLEIRGRTIVQPGQNADRYWVDTLHWDPSTQTLKLRVRTDASGESKLTFARSNGNWNLQSTQEIPKWLPTATEIDNVDLSVKESLTEWPKYFANFVGRDTGAKSFYDPNSRAKRSIFVVPEKFEWRDPSGTAWQGYLLRPVGYIPGHRYPLVIQTHGIQKDKFFLSGEDWGVPAYAAQALASAGFLVVQLEDNPAAGYSHLHPDSWADSFKSAGDALVDSGLADPKRIGLTAYSATGEPTELLLRKYPHYLRAVIMADTGFDDYMAHIQVATYDSPDLQASEIGGIANFSLSGEGIGRWMGQHPLYQMRDVTTAIRLEALQAPLALDDYEAWALLTSKEHTPIELDYINANEHWFFEPDQYLASLDGALDWYKFWLLGAVNKDPSKAAQYARWKKLARHAVAAPTN